MSLINLSVRGDERGSLVAIEQHTDIPFEIKRTFHIYGTKHGTPRGKHSHFVTKQFLVAVSGSCKVTLDDGFKKTMYELNQPSIGLFQNALIWGEMSDFSADCVLLVLASEHYDENDYIRDYDDFIAYAELRLVMYDEVFLDKSWVWLKDKELKHLTMTPDFEKNQQLDFFQSLATREDYYIYGITFDGKPIGACGLKNFTDDKAELWLYIGDKNYWGKGLGKKIMYCLEQKAITKNLNKLYLKVLQENKRAINLYEKLRYVEVSNNEKYITMEKEL